MLERSGLFDANFYVTKYPDVRRNKSPLDHYLAYGVREMRQPNALFDPRYYASKAGIKPTDSPLLHYVRGGEKRGIAPHPAFDPAFYFASNPDVAASRWGALAHYLKFGKKEGRQPRASDPLAPAIDLRHDLRTTRVTILVPVFNGGDHVRRCVESVLANTNLPQAELLLIDDASTDPETCALLEGYAKWPHVTLLRNEQNQGFTRSVNRGLRYAAGRDVVLLNSDTVVGPRWLEMLALVAYGSRSIATATALSDNAGAFSTPQVPNNSTREQLSVNSAARLSSRAAEEEAHFVPTGNGFCMYMRRDALNDVGLLDDVHFPRGYGEENDWCMRAGDRGWLHAIALRAYVHHVNAASFGSETKQLLCDEARSALLELHPDYEAQVRRSFSGETPLSRQRSLFDSEIDQVRRKTQAPPRRRIMFVISTQDGGTPATNDDLMSAIEQLYEPLLLVSSSRELKLLSCSGAARIELARQQLKRGVPFTPHTSQEYDHTVTDWMVRFGVELVHVRHIAWHSLGLVKAARRLCIPTIFSFHDFYTACPSVNLTNGRDEWSPEGVTTPHIQAPLWTGPLRDPEGVKNVQAGDAAGFLAAWKRRMNTMLADCDAFVTTSPVVQAILSQNLPVLRERAQDFHIVPHGRNFERFLEPGAGPSPDRPLRVVVIGNIGTNKGLGTLLDLMKLDTKRVIELHSLGSSPGLTGARGTHHGPYRREALLSQLEAIAPDVGLIPTICPETFSHALSELWAAGLPVVGSELGAIGERIRDTGAGWTFDPRDACGLLELLKRIRSGEEDFHGRAANVRFWQETTGKHWTVEAMANRYLDLYQAALERNRSLLPAAGRRSMSPKKRARVAVVVKGNFPSSLPTAHVRIATPLSLSSRDDVVYDWVDAAELVTSGVRDFDGVIVCRNAHEQPAVLTRLAEQCRTHQVPLVLDLDDDLLNVPPDKDPTQTYTPFRAPLEALMQSAKLLTLSTEPLLQTYAGAAASTKLAPNRLNPRLWAGPPQEREAPEALDKSAKLRVLYMGSATHQEDLELILPAFTRLRLQHKVQLHTIGVSSRAEHGVVALAPPHSRFDDFVQWFRAIAPYFDVAVAPLTDTPFNRCKSDLKFLEYAACGLPVVASRVVPYSLTVHDGVDGLLVDNDEASWFEAMVKLLDPELRVQLGNAARRRAESEFMATSCLFDTLPWLDWAPSAEMKPQAAPGNGNGNGNGNGHAPRHPETSWRIVKDVWQA